MPAGARHPAQHGAGIAPKDASTSGEAVLAPQGAVWAPLPGVGSGTRGSDQRSPLEASRWREAGRHGEGPACQAPGLEASGSCPSGLHLSEQGSHCPLLFLPLFEINCSQTCTFPASADPGAGCVPSRKGVAMASEPGAPGLCQATARPRTRVRRSSQLFCAGHPHALRLRASELMSRAERPDSDLERQD